MREGADGACFTSSCSPTFPTPTANPLQDLQEEQKQAQVEEGAGMGCW